MSSPSNQVSGINRRLSEGNPTMSLSVLTGDASVFTWLFPVSCLPQWVFANRTSCQRTAATRPHCLLHTHLFLQLQWDLLLLLQLNLHRLVVWCCFGLLNPVYSTCIVDALPLCCLQRWSARHILLSSEHAFYAEVGTQKLHVRHIFTITFAAAASSSHCICLSVLIMITLN